MHEHRQDDDDRRLAALFASEPLPDNGFTRRVVRRLRWRLWLQRWLVPVAGVIGAAVAFRPLGRLVDMFGRQAAASVPDHWSLAALAAPLPLLAVGLVVVVATVRTLER